MAGLRHALSIASLFMIHFLSEHEVSGAKNKEMGQGLSYANFVRDPFHHLNATIVGSSLVSKVSACNLACVNEPSCVSFNVAAKPVDNFGHLLCELLATDKHNASDQFHENPDFHYYSIHVSAVGTCFVVVIHAFDRVNSVQVKTGVLFFELCFLRMFFKLALSIFDQSCVLYLQTLCSENPCKNGATCIPSYDDDTFKCRCAAGYKGKKCDKGNLEHNTILIHSL